MKLSNPDAKRFGTELALQFDLVFGTERNQPLIAERVHEFIMELGPSRLTHAQNRVAVLAQQRVAAIKGAVLGEIGQWQMSLPGIAKHLEYLEHRARTTNTDAAMNDNHHGVGESD